MSSLDMCMPTCLHWGPILVARCTSVSYYSLDTNLPVGVVYQNDPYTINMLNHFSVLNLEALFVRFELDPSHLKP